VTPDAIPCRMCQAAPYEPCKYKGAPITWILGGHDVRTPKSHRRYHYKRVADARRSTKKEKSP
jgi:hypothetical protein